MTYEVDSCPVCTSKNITAEKTTLAKFVAWRISGTHHKENLPILHVNRFHEHINFFNKSSLSTLLSNNGFDVVDVYEGKFLCILTKFQ